MKKEKEIYGLVTNVADNLPKTTNSINGVVASMIDILDVLSTPFQALKIYKDSKLQAFKTNLRNKFKIMIYLYDFVGLKDKTAKICKTICFLN